MNFGFAFDNKKVLTSSISFFRFLRKKIISSFVINPEFVLCIFYIHLAHLETHFNEPCDVFAETKAKVLGPKVINV